MDEQPGLFDMEPEARPDRDGGARPKWAGNLSAQARKIVAAMLPAPCWRCGKLLTKDDKWTAGHITDRADGGGNESSNLAPECPTCNYSAGGKRGAATTNVRKLEATDLPRYRRKKWW